MPQQFIRNWVEEKHKTRRGAEAKEGKAPVSRESYGMKRRGMNGELYTEYDVLGRVPSSRDF